MYIKKSKFKCLQNCRCEKNFFKKNITFMILKWYNFYPQKDMLFVSYIKQQISVNFQFQIGDPFRL